MPSLKPVIRKGQVNSSGKCNVKIRISHHRKGDKKGKVRYISTPYYIEPKYMGGDGYTKPSYPSQSNLSAGLLSLMKKYNDAILEMGTDIEYMDIKAIVTRITSGGDNEAVFTDYARKRIALLKKQNRHSLAVLYGVTLAHMTRYAEDEKIYFRDINHGFLDGFNRFLRKHGSGVNTCRNYLCNVRAIFNHAISNDVIKQDMYPFRKYSIRQERKKARALGVDEVRKLLGYRDKASHAQKKAIDIFFLILFLGGINLKDLIYLKGDNLINGRICYKRFKTGRGYSIKIYPEAQELITRYKGMNYLVDLMENKEAALNRKREQEAVSDIRSAINKNLRKVNEKLGLSEKPTTYVARYSFSTIAFNGGVERDTIRIVLGHGMNTMTDLYIDYSQSEAKADECIRKVIDLILQP